METSLVEQIVDEWEKDAHIDPTQIADKTLTTALLHAKYLKMWAKWKQKNTTLKIQLNECKQTKTRYYNGEMSLEECRQLGLEQYQYNKPLKSQLDSLLASDKDVNKILLQQEAVGTIIEVLESILHQIKSRDFEISNFLKAQAFRNGDYS